MKEVRQLIKACKKAGYCCNDFETNAQPIYTNGFRITILSISFMPGFGCAIPLDHFQADEYYASKGIHNFGRAKRLKALRKIGHELIENPKIVKCAWNFKFDGQIWEHILKIFYRGVLLDGMLMKYILNEDKPHDLKEMVRRYLPDVGDYEKAEKFDKIPWDKKELIPLCFYGCQDTDYTLRLCLFFEKKLIDLGFYNVYRNLFATASRVLTSVEKCGLYLDTAFNESLLTSYKDKIDAARETVMNLPRVQKFSRLYSQEKIEAYLQKIQDEIDELDYDDPKDARKIKSREDKIANIRAGIFTTKTEKALLDPPNLNSNVTLPMLMFTHPRGFKFPVLKTTDSGTPSTDEDTLIQLRLTVKEPNSPKAIFLDKLLELRGLEKMYKTYILGWHEKVQDDACLHGRINIHGTDSNRYSSAEPNIQQIPKTSVDPNIKKQLIAPEGKLYLAYDYSQAELRMMAHLSGDETYLRAFREGVDPHLAIAINKYHADSKAAIEAYNDEEHPDHKLWKGRRKQAKQIAFGLIYGIGAKLLAEKLSDPKAGIIVSKEEAQQIMDEFFAEHPKIKKFKDKQERFIRRHGYYRQLFGTKRRLPQIWSNDHEQEAYAIRLGLNFPCLTPTSQALSKTKGWVNYEELEQGDEILAFNRETGKSEWQPVILVNIFDYKGELVRFKTKHLDVLSTPDHRWVVSSTKRISDLTSTRIKTSEELLNSRRSLAIPIQAEHNNLNVATYPDAWVSFIGWYLTDGHMMMRGNIRITQSIKSNKEKVDIIDELIQSLGVRYSEHLTHHGDTKVWTILDKDFVQKIDAIVPGKRMDMKFISSLPQNQLELLLTSLRLGEGWSIFASNKRDQAELVQAIAVLCNNSSSMFELSHKGDTSYFKEPTDYGQESITATQTSYGVKFSNFRKSVNTRNSYNSENNLSKEPYEGKVWCPTVPSGAFFTRVIGEDKRYRTIITGNCQGAAANMTNFGSVLIYWLMRQGKLPRMLECCTVHDSVYQYTLPEYINVWTVYTIWNILRNPSTKHYFGFQINDVDLSMDFSIGRTMAEELPFIPLYDYRKMLDPNFSVEEYMAEHRKWKEKEKELGFDPTYPGNFPKIFKKEMKGHEQQFLKQNSQ